jgi:hypothetical protein
MKVVGSETDECSDADSCCRRISWEERGLYERKKVEGRRREWFVARLFARLGEHR